MDAGAEAAAAGHVVLACPDCGQEQRVPHLSHGWVATCDRCGGTLERRAGTGLDIALAITITGLLLLVPANLLPLFHINLGGAERLDWAISGTAVLWDQGFRLLGVTVGLFAVAAPPLWLGGLATVLIAIRFGHRTPWLGRLFRAVLMLRPWAMVDVYLVGGFVAYTRLQDYAAVDVEAGGWAFVGMALATLAIDPALDRRAAWTAIGPEAGAPPARGDFACLECDRRCAVHEEGRRCPRCGAPLHRRKPYSIERATALVAAGFLLYVPANVLPIMTVVRFGRPEPNTIISGVRELLELGMWPLALIVFMASIVIPLVKLTGLTWFLVTLRRGSAARLATRTKLFRFIEIIGRWSNIDVFMISILAALVQFGSLSSVRAEPGAVAFAAVVVITMFASHLFDPRLMWDAAGART
jgi:paraquat-inducible protein A